MKTKIDENEKITVYISKNSDMDFQDNKKLEESLKKIFLYLKNRYDIIVYGYFNINCYLNEDYGAIMEIEEDDVGFPIYSKKTDIKFTIYKDSTILFKTDNYFIKDLIMTECDIYNMESGYYLELKEPNEKDIAYITENAEIIYGEEVDSVLNA